MRRWWNTRLCVWLFEEILPGRRGWRSPVPAVCTPPWPPWFPSCRCTPCPTPESRSSLPALPRGPRRSYARHLTEAEERDGYQLLSASIWHFLSIHKPDAVDPPGCWSPWQEHCTWLQRLPHGCSLKSRGWSNIQSETFQTQSTPPHSCGQTPPLQGNKQTQKSVNNYIK